MPLCSATRRFPGGLRSSSIERRRTLEIAATEGGHCRGCPTARRARGLVPPSALPQASAEPVIAPPPRRSEPPAPSRNKASAPRPHPSRLPQASRPNQAGSSWRGGGEWGGCANFRVSFIIDTAGARGHYHLFRRIASFWMGGTGLPASLRDHAIELRWRRVGRSDPVVAASVAADAPASSANGHGGPFTDHGPGCRSKLPQNFVTRHPALSGIPGSQAMDCCLNPDRARHAGI